MLVFSFGRDLLLFLFPLVADCCSYTTIRTSYSMVCPVEKGFNENCGDIIGICEKVSEKFVHLLKEFSKVAMEIV